MFTRKLFRHSTYEKNDKSQSQSKNTHKNVSNIRGHSLAAARLWLDVIHRNTAYLTILFYLLKPYLPHIYEICVRLI